MYDQSQQSELIRFARVEPGAIVIDVYPGNGVWTRLFSDAVGPDGRVFGFVPTEILDLKSDQVDLVRTLATERGHQNVEGVSADLVAMPEVTQTADVVCDRVRVQSRCLRAVKARRLLRHRRPCCRCRHGHERDPVAAPDRPRGRPRGGGGGRLRPGRGKYTACERARSALGRGLQSCDQGRDRSLRLSVREALTGSD